MPRNDGTGRLGEGSGIGRSRRGWRQGKGQGGGRGWRHWYHATGLPGWARWGFPACSQYGTAAPPQAEMEFLQEQAKHLQAELEDIERRMKELESAEAGPQEA